MSVETLTEPGPVTPEPTPPPTPGATPVDAGQLVVPSLPETGQGQAAASGLPGIAALLAMAAVLTWRETSQI